jgi:hypothetical protein
MERPQNPTTHFQTGKLFQDSQHGSIYLEMSSYHRNGKIAWNGSTAYHDNGKIAWNGSTGYHANGKIAWNGSMAYHDNGKIAGTSEQELEVMLGSEIRMFLGRGGFRLQIVGKMVA